MIGLPGIGCVCERGRMRMRTPMCARMCACDVRSNTVFTFFQGHHTNLVYVCALCTLGGGCVCDCACIMCLEVLRGCATPRGTPNHACVCMCVPYNV